MFGDKRIHLSNSSTLTSFEISLYLCMLCLLRCRYRLSFIYSQCVKYVSLLNLVKCFLVVYESKTNVQLVFIGFLYKLVNCLQEICCWSLFVPMAWFWSWIQVDLGEISTITGVIIGGFPDYVVLTFTVQYSNTSESADWQSLADAQGETIQVSRVDNSPVHCEFEVL